MWAEDQKQEYQLEGLNRYITHFVKIATEAPIPLYTNMAAVFCFPS